jgi:hypothetical protein
LTYWTTSPIIYTSLRETRNKDTKKRIKDRETETYCRLGFPRKPKPRFVKVSQKRDKNFRGIISRENCKSRLVVFSTLDCIRRGRGQGILSKCKKSHPLTFFRHEILGDTPCLKFGERCRHSAYAQCSVEMKVFLCAKNTVQYRNEVCL